MPAPIYLFTGPELGERNEAVAAVKSAMKKKFGEIDEYLYYASETSFSEVMTTLQSESLFVPASCVVLRGAELLKGKEDVALLTRWADSVTGDSNVLILVSDEISIDAKVAKLVPPKNKQVFWEMFENRKSEWLKKFFKKEGYILGSDAAETILELVENNTEALRTECSKLFLFFPEGYEITVADIEKFLAHNREESAFTLFDTMSDFQKSAQERLESALSVLQKLQLSKNFSSVLLLGGLSYCFRNLILWHTLHAGGATPDDFTLKTKGFASAKARTQYKNAARVWTVGQTTACLALIASTDVSIRSLGLQLENIQLQTRLFSIIMKNGAFCSEYEIDF